MKRPLWVLLLLGVFAGCGGSANSDLPFSLSGSWDLSTRSSTSATNVWSIATVNQTGDLVTGIVAISSPDPPCPWGEVLTGRISGKAINFELDQSGQQVSFTGSIASGGASMSGTYTTTSTGCDSGDSGTWSATKT
jgi:hypothetical protein